MSRKIIESMKSLLNDAAAPREEPEVDAGDKEKQMLLRLAAVAQAEGSLDSEDGINQFIATLKQIATKDKNSLKTMLRKMTGAKAKAAARGMMRGV